MLLAFYQAFCFFLSCFFFPSSSSSLFFSMFSLVSISLVICRFIKYTCSHGSRDAIIAAVYFGLAIPKKIVKYLYYIYIYILNFDVTSSCGHGHLTADGGSCLILRLSDSDSYRGVVLVCSKMLLYWLSQWMLSSEQL